MQRFRLTCGTGSVLAVLVGALAVAAAAGACAAEGHSSPFDLDGGGGGPGGDGSSGLHDAPVLKTTTDAPVLMGGTGTGCAALTRKCSSNCTAFPSAPVIDAMPDDGSPATPANAASYFSAADGSGAGPCLVEPETGTLFPQNWLRPRFRVIPASGQNLFEIKIHATRQANDYLIYTTSKTWKMPKTVWDALRADSWGDAITVTIRGVNTASGAPSSTTGTFTIAPATAGGAMIYWAAVGDQNGMSWLEGFAPGDEGVATTLDVGQVKSQEYRDQGGNPSGGSAAQCIGCHAAVPDGNSVSFVDFYPWPGNAASVNPMSTGAIPSWLTPAGALTLSLPWLGIETFSKTDWMTEQVAITSYGCPAPTAGNNGSYPWSGAGCSDQPSSALIWIDLAAKSGALDGGAQGNQLSLTGFADLGTTWGFIERTGDSNGVEFPNWSHDGTSIVYVSTNAGKDGRLATGTADLYTVPYNARAGGAAKPLSGASDPSAYEYYPAFSEDDTYIAFDHASQVGSNGMYYNPYSEVYVVPAAGASTPSRLAANDPPACEVATVDSGTAGGYINSWPKWAPDVESCPDGNTYYWLVFSSAREGIPFTYNSTNFKSPPAGPTSQLYITGMTVNGGKITSYPALYIWNQATVSATHTNSAQSNHTPIWEVVNIPRPPPPPIAK